MIGQGRILLAQVPVAVHPVKAAMKRIQKTISRSVVGQFSRKHRSTGNPVVVSAARIRHNLVRRVFVSQPYDCVVLCIRPQVQRRCASFHIPAGKGVSVALLQVDSVCPGDRVTPAGRAIDMQPHKCACIHPVRNRRIRHLVPDCVYRRLESVKRVVEVCSPGVVSRPIQRHACLVCVAQKIQALQIHFLRAVRHQALCRCTRRRGRVDHHIVHVEALRIHRISRVSHLHHCACSRVCKYRSALAPARRAPAAQRAPAQCYIPRPRRNNNLICGCDRRTRQLHRRIPRRYRQVRAHRLVAGKVARIAVAAI